MKNIKLTLLLTFIVLVVLNQATFAQTVDERIKRATDAINKNDSDGAMPDIEEVLKLQPTNALALNLRGLVNLRQKNYDQAIADFSQAITSDPKLTVAYYNRGVSNKLKTNPDYKSAIADFSRAIELLPNYGDAYYNRGWINNQLKNWTAAESDLTMAIKYGVNSAEVYIDRGVSDFFLKNYAQAVADNRKALEINPNNELAKKNPELNLPLQGSQTSQTQTDGLSVAELLKLAADAKASGDAVNQEKYLTAAIKLDPKNLDAYEARTILYDSLKKYDLALADAGQLISLNPNDIGGYYIRSIIYVNMRDFAQAIPDYTSLLGLKLTDNQSVKTYYSRGVAYEKNFQYDEAVNDFTKAISLNPNSTNSYNERATIYQGLEKYDLAEADLKKILKIKSDDKNALSILDEIKMMKKVGFNSDHSSGDALLKLVQYLENVTEMEKTYFEKFSLATTKITQNPNATAEICSLTQDANLVLKKIEINVAGINQIASSGKIDKLPDTKNGALSVIKDYSNDSNYRNGINKLAIEHGCKLD